MNSGLPNDSSSSFMHQPHQSEPVKSSSTSLFSFLASSNAAANLAGGGWNFVQANHPATPATAKPNITFRISLDIGRICVTMNLFHDGCMPFGRMSLKRLAQNLFYGRIVTLARFN